MDSMSLTSAIWPIFWPIIKVILLLVLAALVIGILVGVVTYGKPLRRRRSKQTSVIEDALLVGMGLTHLFIDKLLGRAGNSRIIRLFCIRSIMTRLIRLSKI
ncbi:hypothetical protein ACFLZO_00620 [Patescibacteria group bacterium]